jgi:hypothetical protein
MPRTLYRAAARATIAPATFGRGACLCEARADAERYTRNPGFGGEHLFAFDVEPEYVLHVAGRGLRALIDLATALEYSDPVEQAERWGDAGLPEIFEVLENDRDARERLCGFYDWIVYDEPQVADAAARLGADYCRTWRYYGTRPMVGRLA